MSELSHSLERQALICATRGTVFSFFTQTERFAAWWGAGSTIDARPGGVVRICYPNGVVVSGAVLEVAPERRIVFTYGYEGPEPRIPPGGSRVTIELDDLPEGTLVRLRHELADADNRDAHDPGWRYQLSVFANVAAADQHSDLSRVVDRWFEVWAITDAAARRGALVEIVTDDVVYRDMHGCIAGIRDLEGHIGAAQQHIPGGVVARDGEPRVCQGACLVDWVARGVDGQQVGRGTNACELAPDGRVRRVVAFWATS
ncbi:MAG: SRPBCC domain-containing protein [Planctomycetota bacterium]